jgi:putative ATP-binding cassette transporter
METEIPDEKLIGMLETLELTSVLNRSNGLDVEQDWNDILSLGEQQLLAFARLLLAKPQFAILDRISTALSPDDVTHMLHMLWKHSIGYVVLGRDRHGRRDKDDRLENFDVVLQISPDGSWAWSSAEELERASSGGSA